MYTEYKYDSSQPLCSHAYLKAALEKICAGLGTPLRVVDLGCGNGAMLHALSRAGWEAYGVDQSQSGIAEARALRSNIEFLDHDFSPKLVDILGAKSFDLVISTEVVEHLYNPRQLARTSYELLRPGGTVVISTPYHGYAKNCVLALAGAMDTHFTALWDGGHIKFWSYRTLSTLLREEGFDYLAFRGVGRLPLFWKSMVMTAIRPPFGNISKSE